jgi:hypothetical protein
VNHSAKCTTSEACRDWGGPDVKHRQTGTSLAYGTNECRSVHAGPLRVEHQQSNPHKSSAQLHGGLPIVGLKDAITTHPQ